MTLKTYKEWNELGYYILAGEKHVARNKKGECLFDEDQVEEKEEYEEDEQEGIDGYDLAVDWYK